jgi:large subunit ribosomal protein L6
LNADSAKYEAFLKRLYNLMLGVTNGYTMKLRMIGVGYKIFIEEKSVTLKLGFSHEINYVLPEGIKVFQPKAKTPMFIIYGTELSKVAQVAAEIRKLREPEPYKGKGIRYFNEKIN